MMWVVLVVLAAIVVYGLTVWTLYNLQMQCYRNSWRNLDPRDDRVSNMVFCCVVGLSGPLAVLMAWLIWEPFRKPS